MMNTSEVDAWARNKYGSVVHHALMRDDDAIEVAFRLEDDLGPSWAVAVASKEAIDRYAEDPAALLRVLRVECDYAVYQMKRDMEIRREPLCRVIRSDHHLIVVDNPTYLEISMAILVHERENRITGIDRETGAVSLANAVPTSSDATDVWLFGSSLAPRSS